MNPADMPDLTALSRSVAQLHLEAMTLRLRAATLAIGLLADDDPAVQHEAAAIHRLPLVPRAAA